MVNILSIGGGDNPAFLGRCMPCSKTRDTLIEQSHTLIEQSWLFAHETTNSYIILSLLPKKASWQYGLKASRTQNFLGEEGVWGMCSYPQEVCLTVFHTSNTFTTQVSHLTHWPAPLTMLYNTHFSPSQSSIKTNFDWLERWLQLNANIAQSGLFKQVVTNTGCTKLNHLQCIKIHHHGLRKGGIQQI